MTSGGTPRHGSGLVRVLLEFVDGCEFDVVVPTVPAESGVQSSFVDAIQASRPATDTFSHRYFRRWFEMPNLVTDVPGETPNATVDASVSQSLVSQSSCSCALSLAVQSVGPDSSFW